MAARAGGERIGQKAGNGHWPDTARNRGDRARFGRAAVIMTIADKAGFALRGGDAVDAHINHRSPLFDEVTRDHLWAADSGHQNICATANCGQILAAGMGDGDSAAVAKQKLRHRFAHNIRAPNNHSVEARKAAVMIAQHHQAAQWRAGHHGLLPRSKQTHIRDMEPIHILRGVNRIDHKRAVNMVRQGQLHQNTMHRLIRV